MALFNKEAYLKIKEKEAKVKKHTIMIVDDEIQLLESLRTFLADDYYVITASSGAEALEKIEKMENSEELSLVISDQRMPNMTGVQLLTKLVNRTPNTYRMILTAYSDSQVILDAIKQAKIHDYILKPFEPMDLSLRIKNAISNFEQQTKGDEGETNAQSQKIRLLKMQNKALQNQVDFYKKALEEEKGKRNVERFTINGCEGLQKRRIEIIINTRFFRKKGADKNRLEEKNRQQNVKTRK